MIKIWLSVHVWPTCNHLTNLDIFKTWISLELKEIFQKSKQHISSLTDYSGRKDAIFVTVPSFESTRKTNHAVWLWFRYVISKSISWSVNFLQLHLALHGQRWCFLGNLGHIHILIIGLELASNGGSCGRIILKRHGCNLHLKSLLAYASVAEYKYGLFLNWK